MRWFTGKNSELDQICALWPGGYDLEESAREMIFAAARTQCEAYAKPVQSDSVPDNYRLAQVFQARALSRAAINGTDGDILAGTETITMFPMDWTVKRLLNPERRIGGIA